MALLQFDSIGSAVSAIRFFSTAGPNDPARRYATPATKRLADENVMPLIGQQGYFILNARRQAGKNDGDDFTGA